MVVQKIGKGVKGAGRGGCCDALPYANMSKAEARTMLRKVAPWMIRPEEIRKQAVRLLRKECLPAFAKQFGKVILLSSQIADLYEQQSAMNPGPTLLKAQRDGLVEKEIWETLDQLNEAWKKLIQMP